MSLKSVTTGTLLLFALVSAAFVFRGPGKGAAGLGPEVSPAALATANSGNKPAGPAHQVIAFYFHGNVRCPSCMKIEAWTERAIKQGFPNHLKDRRLRWFVVNVEDAMNEHYTKDYKLYTKSVVLSDMQSGKQKRWKNLDKVWALLGDESGFRKYITDEVRAYVGKG